MKRLLSCMLLCVSVQFLASCLSTPAAPATPLPPSAAPEAGGDETDSSAASADSGFLNAGEVETDDAVSIVADSSVAAVPPLMDSFSPEDQSMPSKPVEPPSSPDPQKLLYFYPEPEAVVVTEQTALPPVVSDAPPAEGSGMTDDASPAPVDASAEKAVADASVKEPKDNDETGDADPADDSDSSDAKAETPIPEIRPVEPESPSLKPSSNKSALPPSRTVSLSSGQTLEVSYPGTGWVFLGDSSSRNGLSYLQRKLDGKDTLFSFRARNPGDYVLEFSRFDLLTDAYVPDALSVTVTEPSERKTGAVRAPSWRVVRESAEPIQKIAPPSSISDEPSLRTFSPPPSTASPSSAPVSTSTASAPSTGATPTASDAPVAASSSASSAAEFLAQARASLAAGKPGEALAALDSFFMNATESLDEGWFLRGQSFEAASPDRDIRKAIQAYETLTKAYPASVRWKDADARIRYLRQFYLQIR